MNWGNIIGSIFNALAKIFPFLLAYRAGQKTEQASTNKQTVESQQASSKAAKETKQKIDKDSLADYVKDNDI